MVKLKDCFGFDSDLAIKNLYKLGNVSSLLIHAKISVIKYHLQNGYLIITGRSMGDFWGSPGEEAVYDPHNAGIINSYAIQITPSIFKNVWRLNHADYDNSVLINCIFFVCRPYHGSKNIYRTKFLGIS